MEKIEILRFIEQLDSYNIRQEYLAAQKHLEDGLKRATQLEDEGAKLTILSEMMGFYRIHNKKEKGLKATQEGLSMLEKHPLGDAITMATIFCNAATTLKAFGKAEEAMPYYESALVLYEGALLKTDKRYAALYNNMALAYADLGKTKEALKQCEKALAIVKAQKDGQPEMAITYLNMADIHLTMLNTNAKTEENHEDTIEKLIKMAYNCLQEYQGENDAYFAYVCQKCAPSFGYHGYFLYKTAVLKMEEQARQKIDMSNLK